MSTDPSHPHVDGARTDDFEDLGETLEPIGYAAPGPAEISAPPSTASQEEKDAHWLKHVYQGDRIPQLTVRAVVMGGVLGMFMSISNLYTILKLGFSFGVAITSCVLSYVIWNCFRGVSGGRLTPMTILENNCMQSTATAAGSSTGHTVGLAFGALLLIQGFHTHWVFVTLFVFLTAALGVLVAVPMKRQMINVEQLTFPSGIAAAETLRSLHSHGREAMRKASSLICGLVAGAGIGFFKFEKGVLSIADRIFEATFHIPELIRFGGMLNPMASRTLQMRGLGFEPGTLMIAAGAFMGLRVSLSMLGSSILLYYVVTPLLMNQGVPLFIGGVDEPMPAPAMPPGSLLRPDKWALWAGTSVMLFGSLMALAVQWRTVARAFNVFRRKDADSAETALAALEVPMSWVIIGVIPVGIGLIAVNMLAFKMSWYLGAISVAMSFVTALVAGRACGETDFTPTGAMGKITQLLYAVLAKGNQVVNLMSAGVTAAASAAGADLLLDLKAGYLLGANPRKQFIAQFCGIFFGVLAIVPAWYLMVPNLEELEKYPLPATEMWRAVAVALTKGLDTISVSARYSIIVGAMIGMALPVIGAIRPRLAPSLPSAIGLGLAWVVPFQTSLSFAIGAVLAWGWLKLHRRTANVYTFPIAAGLIAGESIILALLAMAATSKKLLGW